ncbi:hypothetical protein [Vibrio sp. ER1A]|uniref:hypothetical protein n=1 Tax=Vibrio sp. ER1A TaxID=1517681 RepID=UPI0004DD7C74|nr:hypothetical protein [Vibrio sp. ER1A]KFA99677.1 hypothetical protein HW45_01780 [Vibrio sp. ER1A]
MQWSPTFPDFYMTMSREYQQQIKRYRLGNLQRYQQLFLHGLSPSNEHSDSGEQKTHSTT